MRRENDFASAVDWTGRLEAIRVRRLATLSLLAAALLASALTLFAGGADGPRLESGLRVGEIANMFSVQAITGPYRGKTLCYRCELGNSPVVCVFARA